MPLNDSVLGGAKVERSGTLLAVQEGSREGAGITVRDAADGFAPRVFSQDPNVVGVRIAGGRVAIRPAGGWYGDPILEPWITDPAGAARPIWFPLPAAPLQADFDGIRLAVAAGRCIWLGDARNRLSGPLAGTCPQQATGQGERRITRRGSRYPYGIHCLMAPVSGCRGTARLEAGRRERGPRKAVAVRRFHAERGGATTVRFRVPRTRLRALRNKNGTVCSSSACARRTPPVLRASPTASHSARGPDPRTTPSRSPPWWNPWATRVLPPSMPASSAAAPSRALPGDLSR